jgi:hypothetical protein
VLNAVDTTSVSIAAISDPIAVSATTHLVADFLRISAPWHGRLEVVIRGAGGIQRSPRKFLADA